MTEISPSGIRGSVGVCSQVGIVMGIAFANFLTAPSFNMLGSMEKWRYVFLVPSAFSIFQLCVLPFCPESPAFLIKAQGEGVTLATLKKLHREMSAGQPPNPGPEVRRERGRRVLVDEVERRADDLAAMRHPRLRALAKMCLADDPDERPTAAELHATVEALEVDGDAAGIS